VPHYSATVHSGLGASGTESTGHYLLAPIVQLCWHTEPPVLIFRCSVRRHLVSNPAGLKAAQCFQSFAVGSTAGRELCAPFVPRRLGAYRSGVLKRGPPAVWLIWLQFCSKRDPAEPCCNASGSSLRSHGRKGRTVQERCSVPCCTRWSPRHAQGPLSTIFPGDRAASQHPDAHIIAESRCPFAGAQRIATQSQTGTWPVLRGSTPPAVK
jgi:hypothetical protein